MRCQILILPLVLSTLSYPLLAQIAEIQHSDRHAPQGWHWYNETQDNDVESAPIRPMLTPSQQKKRLQQATQAALDTAILYPTPENFRHYMTWQNFWTAKAGEFSQMAKQAMLKYPDLDYNLQYSHYNGTVKAQLVGDREKEKTAISALALRYGVFFFYRGRQDIDGQMARVIKNFVQENRLALIPVSVDGVINPVLPRSRQDQGHSQRMGIVHFPALFLVDPKDQNYQPLAYGFMTQDALARQFLAVATGFKPNF
ncbi:type-F conjugative transfer system pilin assembly protein TraF [Candidatus Fukatsuia symbiotica]|uniref:type-F conjugative transfer system pilin assembly protein TraF n=1 Tax=Candidatus Fukatsuia TaxID=1927833 RepID=UPI000E71C1AD